MPNDFSAMRRHRLQPRRPNQDPTHAESPMRKIWRHEPRLYDMNLDFLGLSPPEQEFWLSYIRRGVSQQWVHEREHERQIIEEFHRLGSGDNFNLRAFTLDQQELENKLFRKAWFERMARDDCTAWAEQQIASFIQQERRRLEDLGEPARLPRRLPVLQNGVNLVNHNTQTPQHVQTFQNVERLQSNNVTPNDEPVQQSSYQRARPDWTRQGRRHQCEYRPRPGHATPDNQTPRHDHSQPCQSEQSPQTNNPTHCNNTAQINYGTIGTIGTINHNYLIQSGAGAPQAHQATPHSQQRDFEFSHCDVPVQENAQQEAQPQYTQETNARFVKSNEVEPRREAAQTTPVARYDRYHGFGFADGVFGLGGHARVPALSSLVNNTKERRPDSAAPEEAQLQAPPEYNLRTIVRPLDSNEVDDYYRGTRMMGMLETQGRFRIDWGAIPCQKRHARGHRAEFCPDHDMKRMDEKMLHLECEESKQMPFELVEATWSAVDPIAVTEKYIQEVETPMGEESGVQAFLTSLQSSSESDPLAFLKVDYSARQCHKCGECGHRSFFRPCFDLSEAEEFNLRWNFTPLSTRESLRRPRNLSMDPNTRLRRALDPRSAVEKYIERVEIPRKEASGARAYLENLSEHTAMRRPIWTEGSEFLRETIVSTEPNPSEQASTPSVSPDNNSEEQATAENSSDESQVLGRNERSSQRKAQLNLQVPLSSPLNMIEEAHPEGNSNDEKVERKLSKNEASSPGDSSTATTPTSTHSLEGAREPKSFLETTDAQTEEEDMQAEEREHLLVGESLLSLIN